MEKQFIEQRDNLLNQIEKINRLSSVNNFSNINKISSNLLTRIKDSSFRITVVGEFNRGKSTLVNALLEEDLIPTAARETTATINVIGFENKTRITIVDKDAGRKEITSTKEAFKEYTSLKEFDPSTVHHIEIECPAIFLKNNVFLVDTPGVNDISKQRLEITYGYMPLSDATIILLDATKPFTNSEKTFIQDHILKNNIPTLFFILNKIDLIDESQIDFIINDVAEKLKETLNITEVAILPISSDLAQKGIFNNDGNSLERSRFLPFKEKLLNFITDSSRSVSLIKGTQLQINSLLNIFLEEIDLENAQLQMNSADLEKQLQTLSLSKEEFKIDFNEIIKYIGTDAEALNARIETTLLNRYKELYDSLFIEIDTKKVDLTEYAEKILPFKFNQSMKQWIDNNSNSIDEFIQFTISNSITAFQNSFSKVPMLSKVNTLAGFSSPSKITSFKVGGKEKLEKANTIATLGGGILAGILAIASGGLSVAVIMPSLIGSSFLSGKYLTPHFTKKILEEQKNELKQLLRIRMKAEFETAINTLHEYCSEYYGNLIKDLEKEFDQVFKDLSTNIQNRINEGAKKGDSFCNRAQNLLSLKDELHEINLKVQQIHIN
ncbi:MAG: dynamin family protein [Ignavibacteriaceae bacterium]|nr:dynamin family protein [Ignavibacteriaceae bacterium]